VEIPKIKGKEVILFGHILFLFKRLFLFFKTKKIIFDSGKFWIKSKNKEKELDSDE
jgi:hypothetical protein